MLNIFSIITDKELPDGLLTNHIWKQVDFYRFCSDSKYWGCAHLNKLPKTSTANPAEALLYLLQAERFYLRYPNAADAGTVTSFFNDAIADGYFANPTGKAITTAVFQQHYEDIMKGIEEEESFEVYKNGEQQLPEQLPQIADVLFVTAYANEWNNRQYFIESEDAWLLFGWATMA